MRSEQRPAVYGHTGRQRSERGIMREQGMMREEKGTRTTDRETAIEIGSGIVTTATKTDMGAGGESARSESSDARYYDTIHMMDSPLLLL